MAETNPVAAPPPVEDVYRPLSMPAIAGLCLSAIYAALVLMTTAVALFKGAPFFLPGWFILVAILGALLSYFGLRQISQSEGTRAGAAVARAGLWLSIVPGLGYTAYSYFTGLALTQQANRFIIEPADEDSGFFARLQEGTPEGLEQAFLLTLPYGKRAAYASNRTKLLKDFGATHMGDEGELGKFRDNPMVRVLIASAKQTTVEPLGVLEWSYEQGSYKVVRAYNVVTPAAEMHIVLTAVSTEGEDSEGRRKWFVAFSRLQPVALKMTALGLALQDARFLANQAAERWLEKAQKAGKFDLVDDTNYNKVTPAGFAPEELRGIIRGVLDGSNPETKGVRPMASPE